MMRFCEDEVLSDVHLGTPPDERHWVTHFRVRQEFQDAFPQQVAVDKVGLLPPTITTDAHKRICDQYLSCILPYTVVQLNLKSLVALAPLMNCK